MKYAVAAGILLQALPVLSGGILEDAVLGQIKDCDPLSEDAHIGRASCDSGFECIVDEGSELGGTCISLSVIQAIAAAAVRDLQDNITDTNTTEPETPTPSEAPTAVPTPSSASLLCTSTIVSMVGVAAAGVLAWN